MTTEAAFLEAICQSPEDDASRLVYSDWLEDRQQPGDLARAEFIRLQVRLATLQPWDDEYDELKLREDSLIQQHADTWLEPVRPWLHSTFETDRDARSHKVFRRGFVENVIPSETRFLEDPEGLLTLTPVTGLLFFVRNIEPILACPALRRIQRLRFLCWSNRNRGESTRTIALGRGDFRRIAECSFLTDLKELNLSSQIIPAEEVADLVRSPHLANLESLSLAHSCLDAEGFDVLGRGMALPALRHLYVNNNYEQGRLSTWVGRTWLQRLRSLNLTSSGASCEEALSLLESSPWPELETLHLGSMGGSIRWGDLARLGDRLPRLRHLSVERSPVLANSLAGIRLDQLVSLNLDRVDDAMIPLREMTLPSLRILSLESVNMTEDLADFSQCPFAPTLRALDLQHVEASFNDHVAFIRRAQMPELRSLSLGHVTHHFTPRVLRELGEATGWPNLRSLTIHLPGQKQLYAELAEMPLLGRLQHLRIWGGTLTDAVIQLLTTAPGFASLPLLELRGISANSNKWRRLRDHFGPRLLI